MPSMGLPFRALRGDAGTFRVFTEASLGRPREGLLFLGAVDLQGAVFLGAVGGVQGGAQPA